MAGTPAIVHGGATTEIVPRATAGRADGATYRGTGNWCAIGNRCAIQPPPVLCPRGPDLHTSLSRSTLKASETPALRASYGCSQLMRRLSARGGQAISSETPAIVHGAGIGIAAADSPARPRSFAEPADRVLTSPHAPPCRRAPAPVVATFLSSNRLRRAARRTDGCPLPRAPERRRRTVPRLHHRRRSRRLAGADGCPCFGAGSTDSVPLGGRSARASRFA